VAWSNLPLLVCVITTTWQKASFSIDDLLKVVILHAKQLLIFTLTDFYDYSWLALKSIKAPVSQTLLSLSQD